MTKETNIIKHEGVVIKIENGVIYVDIEVKSACANCHASVYCSAFGKKDKTIEIESESYPHIIVNDNVNVIIKETLGIQALVLGYIFPVIVLLFALFSSIYFTKDEGLAALNSIAAVILYYTILYAKRKSIKKHFFFSLEKI